ncbi:hypothetical protein PALS2_101 [Staphylococcus phage PALS_2]|nr:hypothetical protein PALS2_101 [Staphylococcus phage PALS_2]
MLDLLKGIEFVNEKEINEEKELLINYSDEARYPSEQAYREIDSIIESFDNTAFGLRKWGV